ncbi:TraB/GumN family protein [Novosphingobium sp. MMS21-SN21R]|uniref:TraB/GumN family protein n=1 Tax=Novosphingobium sp. MMS21-SN21R TaxID=2969298 RepID=UPI0028839CF6|nr:TraB/GumN family protein [Novosphingobium sp. MMS21-SN21R]MDT0507877.1 TraB/GumN family protein [Novosphingobium sp. MMS21-SN21R]
MTLAKTFAGALTLVAIALAGPVHAGTRPAKPAVATPAPKQLKPALWKVADADTTIYLFGTIHALPRNLAWLDGPVASALDGSDQLVTEIADSPAAEQQKAIVSLGLLQGETLRSLMKDEDLAAYEALLVRLKLPPEAFDKAEPWLAGLTIGMMPYAMSGYGKDDGAEAVLRKAAAAKGKKEGALETLDFQLGLFDSLPREAQLTFLAQAVRDFDKSFGLIGTMTDQWGAGDSDALARLLNDEMDDPELAETLLFQRNRNWTAWIAKRLDQPGQVFIAVGAGHLAGANSVLDLLKRQGVESVRVQ